MFNRVLIQSTNLDVRWVQEDSNRSTEGLGWQIVSEGGSNDTRVTVSSGNLTPHNSNLRTPDFLGGSVDVGNTLTQVKLSILWSSDTFDLDQRDIWVVDSLGSLVG